MYLDEFYVSMAIVGDTAYLSNRDISGNWDWDKISYLSDNIGECGNNSLYTDSYYNTVEEYKNAINQVEKVVIMEDIQPFMMSEWFAGMENLKTIEGLELLDTSKCENMAFAFYGCKSLKEIDFSEKNMENVEKMEGMFKRCTSLENVSFKDVEAPYLHDTTDMFKGCKKLETVDLENFKADRVNYAVSMFEYCEKLKEVDLSSFNCEQSHTSKICTLGMFDGCTNLENVNVNGWNINNIDHGNYMFNNCPKLNPNNLEAKDLIKQLQEPKTITLEEKINAAKTKQENKTHSNDEKHKTGRDDR